VNQTLLDGEITYNFHYKKYCYMIFDVLAVCGKRYAEQPLYERLNAIRELVVAPFRQKCGHLEQELHLLVLGKDFFPLAHLPAILQKIQHYPPEVNGTPFHRYIYRNDKRYNDNDGLIFTPEDRPYRPYTNKDLYKWKWPSLRSADFLLKYASHKCARDSEKEFDIFMQGDSGNLIRWQRLHIPADMQSKICQRLESCSQVVVECTFDCHLGEWKFLKLRLDKYEANHIKTVLHTLQCIAQDIKDDELRQLAASVRSSQHFHHLSLPTKATSKQIRTPPRHSPLANTHTQVDNLADYRSSKARIIISRQDISRERNRVCYSINLSLIQFSNQIH